MARGKFASTNHKHFSDPGSDVRIHQNEISVLVSQTSFREVTSGAGAAKCRLFSQARFDAV